MNATPKWVKDEELETEKGKKFFPSWTKIKLTAIIEDEVFCIDDLLLLKETGGEIKHRHPDISETAMKALDVLLETHLIFRKVNSLKTKKVISGFCFYCISEFSGVLSSKNNHFVYVKKADKED